MPGKVAIVGIGQSQFSPGALDKSFRDIVFEAVTNAHRDAGITNDQVESVITTGEDFAEGRAITDEFILDPSGGYLKPNGRICADSLHGVFNGYMQIQAGLFDLVVCVGYQKTSEIVNHGYLASIALDPVWERPLGQHPYYIMGLEMRSYMHKYGVSEEEIAQVVAEARRQGLKNSRSLYAADLKAKDIINTLPLCDPLKSGFVAPDCDGAVAVVLASEKKAKSMGKDPLWIEGLGWASDASSSFWYKKDNLADAVYMRLAGEQAYRMAGITKPAEQIDLAEIDDRYIHKLLTHVEALGLSKPGRAATDLVNSGNIPVNRSGGLFGLGCPHNATGLALTLEAANQLRGQAGDCQIPGAKRALVAAWTGLPSRSGGALILGKE